MDSRRRFHAGPYPEGYPATVVQPPSQEASWVRYLYPTLWRSLLQTMTHRRHWLQAAAIAYGHLLCLLLAFFVLLSAVSLLPEGPSLLTQAGRHFGPAGIGVLRDLSTQLATDWPSSHRWLLLLVCSVAGLSLWLRGVGLLQQALRISPGSGTAISLRQRLNTALVAGGSLLLLLLAYGLAFAIFPAVGDPAAAPPESLGWGRRLVVEGLRWSLVLSTVALMFGLFYRLSLRTAKGTLPILPGTLLAMGIWAIFPIAVKVYAPVLSASHWLYGAVGTVAIVHIGLYVSVVGLLAGGTLNGLVTQSLPGRSRNSRYSALPPPPSFESFTIHRRPR